MLDDVASVTLSTALTALAARQRVSAHNIANIETPNFRAGQLSFEDNLRQAVSAGEPAQAAVTITPSDAPVGINGNNVSLDTETLTDQKTALQFRLLSGAMSAKFELLNTVLKG
ncbi:MAG TPA: flagellar basal body protein [Jatrophihabitans sp.]|uniref:flagellar basal body rod protein FlgB n=1 Tax=Jatrophihabitans sp. TaxID=1932789 RepID=UPI002EE3F9EB